MFDGYIRDNACWAPRDPAVITPRRTVSFAAFDADIDRLANALPDVGVTRACGVVSVCLDDPYLTLATTAALARLRIPSAPFNDWGADVRLIQRTGAGGEAPGPRLLLLDRDWLEQTLAGPATPAPRLDVDPDAVGRVMLSSGTTRAARRVAFTWRRMELVNLAHIRSYAAGAQGLFVPLTTIESTLGWATALAGWSLGGAVGGGFHMRVEDMVAALETHAEGVVTCTPAQLRTILAGLPHGFAPRPRWRIATGGAVLPEAVARAARTRITPDVRLIYGSTESSLIAVGHAAQSEDEPLQTGLVPTGSVLEVTNEEGRPVADGESGEIRVWSQRGADSYVGDAEATAERFTGGWFLTRDVGRRLPDGRVVLEGRVDERMNLGGRKFMPQVLEDAAAACPGVLDCAAFAAPDGQGEDQCWLAVVAADGFDRASLAAFLAARPEPLPPPRFAWTDAIPRNAMGKIDRQTLRAALLAAQGAA